MEASTSMRSSLNPEEETSSPVVGREKMKFFRRVLDCPHPGWEKKQKKNREDFKTILFDDQKKWWDQEFSFLELFRDKKKGLKSLEKMKFNACDLNARDMRIFLHKIGNSLRKLSCLEIQLGKDCDMKEFAEEFGKVFQNLKEFSLKFPHPTSQGEKEALLGSIGTNFKKLRKFILDPNYLRSDDPGIDADECMLKLLRILKNNPKLEALEFSFFREATDETLQTLTDKFQQFSSGLQHLKISLSLCDDLSEDAMSLFVDAIGNLIALKTLKLRFCEWFQPSTAAVTNTITKLLSLESLALILHFESKESSDKQELDILIRSLVVAIQDLGELIHLRLDLYHAPLSNQTIQTFGKALKNLQQLQRLSVDFSSCEEFSDIKDFQKGIENLELKDLKLDFAGCHEAFENGWVRFSFPIGKFKQLRSLSLDFSDLDISDEGLAALARGMPNLHHLQALELNLAGWQQRLSNKGLKKLGSYLGTMKHLRRFKLYLGMTKKITAKGVKDFGRLLLSNTDRSTKLKLDFYFESNSLKDAVQKILKKKS